MATIRVGNHINGYHSAEVSLITEECLKLYHNHELILIGNVQGDKTLITKAINSYNRGFHTVVTSTGDELPIVIIK